MMQKRNLATVGFEPTPPKRLVPKTSALDHSATLPDTLNVCPKHRKSRSSYHLLVMTGQFEETGCCRSKGLKVKSSSAWLPAHES